MDHCAQVAPCPDPDTLPCWPWGCEDASVGARAAVQGLATSLFLGVKGEADLVLVSIAVALLRGLSRLGLLGHRAGCP